MDNDRRLLAALRRIATDASDGTRCPDAEVLAELALGGREPAVRAPILDHVTGCARCRDALRAALSLAADAPAEAPPAPVISHRARRRRRAMWVAAAASLAIAMSLGILLRGSLEQAQVLRGGEAVSAPFDGEQLRQAPDRLQWQPVAGATGYRVQLMDRAARPIWRSEALAEPTLLLPREARSRIGPGLWLWQVEVELGDGSREMGPYAFEVRL